MGEFSQSERIYGISTFGRSRSETHGHKVVGLTCRMGIPSVRAANGEGVSLFMQYRGGLDEKDILSPNLGFLTVRSC